MQSQSWTECDFEIGLCLSCWLREKRAGKVKRERERERDGGREGELEIVETKSRVSNLTICLRDRGPPQVAVRRRRWRRRNGEGSTTVTPINQTMFWHLRSTPHSAIDGVDRGRRCGGKSSEKKWGVWYLDGLCSKNAFSFPSHHTLPHSEHAIARGRAQTPSERTGRQQAARRGPRLSFYDRPPQCKNSEGKKNREVGRPVVTRLEPSESWRDGEVLRNV